MGIVKALLPLTIVCSIACAMPTTDSTPDPRGLLIQDVAAIAFPGAPGPLCVFGNDAFSVVTAKSDDVPAPLVAASKPGKGRVVAFGHEGYFAGEALRTADTARLVAAAILWAGDNLPMIKKRQISVATHHLPDLSPILRQFATDVVTALDGDDFAKRLDNIDVLVIPAGDIKPGDVEPLRKFLARGGGIVAGMPGWGWLQTHPGKSLSGDCPANRLFADAGIAWSDGEIDEPPDRRLLVSQAPPSPLLNADDALVALVTPWTVQAAPPPDADCAVAVRQVLRCLDSIPPDVPLARRFKDLSQFELPRPKPTATKPITDKDGLMKVLVALDTRWANRSAPDVFEDAAVVDESKPPEATNRVARELSIDTAVPGWHSTGLFAPRGQLISVATLNAGSAPLNLQVRIGAQSDHLWHLKEWKRAPQVDRTFPISASETKVANYFGGLIYIVVPESTPRQTLRIRIDGAVEAPWFVLGKTDPKEWRERIRNAPAPWAELQSDKIIITIPSEHVRKLDDPTELMKFWDRVADADADLATIPHERRRPERYVADVQISAGYMHAGYPIMTHLDAAPRFVDLATLQRDGDWGMFHELGHNHQSADWTFDGTGEVTVNLFTMYVLDTVCTGGEGQGGGKMHKAMSSESRARMEAKYRANGAKFEDWKRDPFLALIMYKQLQEAFGWDAYKKVFAEYRALRPEERPKTDDEKRDQFMVRFSRAVGKNLGPFFQSWSIPTSEMARKSIADLPHWMPESSSKN